MLQPIDPILLDRHEITSRIDRRQEYSCRTKNRCTSICPPGSSTIDDQSPDQQSDSEDEEKSRVEHVSNSVS